MNVTESGSHREMPYFQDLNREVLSYKTRPGRALHAVGVTCLYCGPGCHVSAQRQPQAPLSKAGTRFSACPLHYLQDLYHLLHIPPAPAGRGAIRGPRRPPSPTILRDEGPSCCCCGQKVGSLGSSNT